MKKKKLHLNELKVKSFITELPETTQLDIKGGKEGDETSRAMKKHDYYLPLNIKVHVWTVSEVRNDGKFYIIKNDD